MKNNRIEYIDALRGFTMLLVVFAHVETFMLSIDPSSTLISGLFLSFLMPLFFFISGYISYKRDNVGHKLFYVNNLVKRIRIQIIPTMFFGVLFTYMYSIGDFESFINNYDKYGYWFTLCLFGMFLILFINNFLVCGMCKKTSKKILSITLLVITIGLHLFKFLYDNNSNIKSVSDIFCFHQVCVYFPFFIFGYIASLFKEEFNKLLENKKIQALIFILFLGTFYIQYMLPPSIFEVNRILLLYRSLQYIIVGASGICIVYNFFRINESLFSKETKLGFILQKIGGRTLEIYLLHYFFLSQIHSLGNYIKNDIILELSIGLILAFFIIVCCLFVANLLRMSKSISYFLLGTQKK